MILFSIKISTRNKLPSTSLSHCHNGFLTITSPQIAPSTIHQITRANAAKATILIFSIVLLISTSLNRITAYFALTSNVVYMAL